MFCVSRHSLSTLHILCMEGKLHISRYTSNHHHHPCVVSTTVLFDYAGIVLFASSYLLLLHNHEGYFAILCNNTSTKVHIGGWRASVCKRLGEGLAR